ncbi:MAG: cytochrome b/b6 domain-containing protein [Coriobacteriia bacterium]|nr:cytochrome b/b6 domain-containing protein [Coriobacteriia bacterium]
MHKPIKEMHPPVFVATHWINFVAIVILMLSGLYIHFPSFGGFMSVARGCHIFFGVVIFLNVVFRIIAAFFVKDANTMGSRETDLDIKNFWFQKENRHQFFPMLRWYLFMKKDYPISAKYATLQKISYMAIAVMLLCVSYTGFCLWGVTNQLAIFAVGNNLFASIGFGAVPGGGALMATRVIHYIIAWLLVIIALIHIYIATMHGMSAWRMIFLHKEDPDAGEGVADAPAEA